MPMQMRTKSSYTLCFPGLVRVILRLGGSQIDSSQTKVLKLTKDVTEREGARRACVATAALMTYSAPHKYITARKREVRVCCLCLFSYLSVL